MTKINTALVGYGAMGKEIEKQAIDKNINITHIFDLDRTFSRDEKYDFDVAIEFTQPDSVIDNIKMLAEAGKNIVVGTTGWQSKTHEIKSIVKSNKIGLVWAPNFSIGMNIFFKIVQQSAFMFSDYEDYDIFLHELHHKRKKDSPSGTATALADIILRNNNHKREILTETSHKQIMPEQLHVSSTRGGEIFGTHTVYIDSLADTIELTHRARTRSGFALGAIKAAELIYGKQGFFEFSELLF